MMNSDNSADLLLRRKADAEYSKGVSGTPIREAILRCLAEFKISGTILDLGCGRAELSLTLLELDGITRVACADLLERPDDLPSSVDWFSADLNEPLTTIKSTSFDNVLMVEVIEHLENPRAIAREVFRVLRPGGIFILSTPNNEAYRSIISLLVRGHFPAFIDGWYPGHKTALLRQDISHLLMEAGFTQPVFRYSDSGHMPKCGMTWQRASFGLLKGLRFSDNIIAIATKK